MSNQQPSFSLTQIEYVLAVLKFGHFSQAAKSLHITQPTLSMQIQKLEEHWGFKIFDRTKKPILLTDRGKILVEQMKVLMREAQKIEKLAELDPSQQLSGELNLAVIPTIAPYVLPLLFPIVAKQFPKMKLKIQEMQTHKIIEALDEDHIDVGLLATPLKIERMTEFALYYEPFAVLVHKEHSLSKKNKLKYNDLGTEGLWLLEEGHCLRNQILDVCAMRKSKGSELPFEFESGSIQTLQRLVNHYGGFTLVPALAEDAPPSNALYLHFERPIPSREVGLIYRREIYKAPLIEALGESILAAIPEKIRKLRKKDLDVLPV